ncbi:MAG: hypothetical protein B6I28_04890 [Fusobacteriia bacterium 4572_132]|nr:MAG: hypothetical protein B6I28_04890 [Fusobacteriia bacterium 4572_132]
MIDFVFEIFKYKFFINAALAVILATISCGIIGTYIVNRKMVFISGGITHASFGGIGIGFFLGINPIVSAAIFAVLSSIGIEYISEKIEITKDSLIGILWSFGMAIGIIFISLTPGYAPNLMTYLFGNILTVSDFDLKLMLGLNIILIIVFKLFLKEIIFISFDEIYLRSKKIPTKLMNYFLISLVALTIVINIKIVGIILVISFLTIPQAIAGIFSKKYIELIIYSIFFGFLGGISGLLVSYFLDIPSGASIIFSYIVIFGFLKILTKIIK